MCEDGVSLVRMVSGRQRWSGKWGQGGRKCSGEAKHKFIPVSSLHVGHSWAPGSQILAAVTSQLELCLKGEGQDDLSRKGSQPVIQHPWWAPPLSHTGKQEFQKK